MSMGYEDKLLTLSNGYQYVVLDRVDYEEKSYALVNEVVDGHLGSNATIYRIEPTAGMPVFIKETNLKILESVLAKLAC